ncbi:cytochrome P450 [Infundibulicybe gibba]|nr:cytochrome P450 [Infundibulicybe gibba]
MAFIHFSWLSISALVTYWILRRIWANFVIVCIDKTLPGPTRASWITGNILQLRAPTGLADHHALLDKYGSAAKIHGLFGDEQIYFSDPLAIRHILINDLSVFRETRVFVTLNKLIFGDALTTVHDAHHRKQRKILNPLFSAKHMRELAPIIHGVAYDLRDSIKGKIQQGETKIDVLSLLWCTAIESLGQAGLGYSFGGVDERENNAYRDSVKHLFPALDSLGPIVLALPTLSRIGTSRLRRYLVDCLPSSRIQKFKGLIDIIDINGRDILNQKRDGLNASPVESNKPHGRSLRDNSDIVTRLLSANESSSQTTGHLSKGEVLALISHLLFASSETTSGLLARILEMLARHPDVQGRLRNELQQIQAKIPVSEGEIFYKKLGKLPYLNAVINESLRLYPPVILMERTATKDIVVPLHTPVKGTDGQLITQIHVAKNQNVTIGIANCNRDRRNWGHDADEWRPERWLEPLPATLVDARIPGVHPHMMTFLGGERSCIGYSFALLEMEIVLWELISNFEFNLSDETISWRLGSTQYPQVPGKGIQMLPLEVSTPFAQVLVE